MYRDLVYRPEEESYGTRDFVFRPGVDKSFAEVLPYMPPRTHTPLNPNSGSPYDIIRERRPSSPINNEEPLPYWKRPGPGSGGGIIEEKPRDPGISEIPTTYDPQISSDFLRKIENADRAAKAFLDLFMLDRGLHAGYVPFKGVAPADVDPGGPESPEAMARLAEYLNRRRQRGDFERARQRLIQKGFPLGGV